MVVLPWWSYGKESVCSARDWGLIPGLGRSFRKGNGNPLQYSCLENSWTEEPEVPDWVTSTFTLHFCHFVKWFLSDFSTVNSLFSHFVLYVLETKN